MRILSTCKELTQELSTAITEYKTIRFSVAWASANHDVFRLLTTKNNLKKIFASTVGLHFEQTHPDFIKIFLKEETRVKFIKKKNGIFHPKIYLFYNNENDWKAFIGSANFTYSALNDNDEVMVVVESNNKKDFGSFIQILDDYYMRATVLSKEDFEKYKSDREKSQNKKKEISRGNFSSQNKQIIIGRTWDEYYTSLKNDGQELQLRLNVLSKAKEYFQKSFKDLTELQRKNIGGILKRGDGIDNWFVFGHMPVQLFASRLSDGDKKGLDGNIKSFMKISKALDFIPLTGEVSKQNFDKCMKYFKDYKGWGYSLSTVSRLLAMKRPDQFFCITGINKKQGNYNGFQKYFGKPKKLKTYDDYWEYVIENVRKEKWYKSQKPRNSLQLEIWNGRVALMDALFYDE